VTTESTAKASHTPSRGIALLLGLLGPWGAGHFYLGQKKRAVLWLGVPSALLFLWATGLPWLGSLFGYGLVFSVLCAGLLAAWAGSLVDLDRVPEERLRGVDGLEIFGYWIVGVAFVIIARQALRSSVMEAFKIPSGEMQPALMVGDHILADKLVLHSRKPKRGEVIVFKFPEHPDQNLVMRVIAIPGDTLLVKSGRPWLNGSEIPHCVVGKGAMPDGEGRTSSGEIDLEYLDGAAYLSFFDEDSATSDTLGPFPVADNEVWVLGDNRKHSDDSRSWFGGRGGGVPLDLVVGRGLFRWASDPGGRFDWSRYGTGLGDPLLPGSMRSLEAGLKKCLAQGPAREATVPPR
jgi:signal peptidase I